MVDYNELRKKFPPKDPNKQKRVRAIKAINREYAQKKADLGLIHAPVMKKGIVFYSVIVIALMLLGSLVLSATGKGGKAFLSKAKIQSRQSVDALAIALGRYRYHTGEYPTTAEGLAQLASVQVVKKGWNGPYIKRVVKDPWGRDYVYRNNGESENPTLYSKGPDGIDGTTDDVLPRQELFEEPFRDTSWLKEWVPYRLRGYVVAPDEETKKLVEAQVASCLKNNSEAMAEHDDPKRSDANVGAAFRRAASAMAKREPFEEGDGGVEIVSPWVAPDGAAANDLVEVECKTSGDEVELFVNGKSAGKKKAGARGEARWSVNYEDGEIRAVASREGFVIGEDRRKTPRNAAKTRVRLEETELDENDATFAVIDVVDEYSESVPFPTGAGSPLSIAVDGPGVIMGYVNKNGEISKTPAAASMEIPPTTAPVAVVIKRETASGNAIKITVSMPGLTKSAATISFKRN